MKFSPKYYKVLKTKAYLKSDFFAFYSGVHQNSTEWSKTEQALKKKKLAYYKVFNRTAKTLLKQSVYKTTGSLLGSLTFFFKPVEILSVKSMFQLDLFTLLAVKINKNLFSSEQIKQLYSPDYCESALLLYQFKLISIKTYLKK